MVFYSGSKTKQKSEIKSVNAMEKVKVSKKVKMKSVSLPHLV